MNNLTNIIDSLRYKINLKLNLDVVRFAGQHTLRAHIARIIKEYRINAIIDVGANEGQFARQIRSLGFTGDIYSFEPVLQAYQKLALMTASDNKLKVFNFALGSESGEAEINVSKGSAFSSILNANDYGNAHWTNMKPIEKQKIIIKTLDGCVRESLLPSNARFLLKMDTQGYDLEVFKGSQNTLSSICCMLSELSIIPIYHGMPSYYESLHCYESKGFLISGLYPITRNKNLSLNEIDCMLVNTSFYE